MTSGSTAKARIYLRNSFLRVLALLVFVCSLTTLLAMQLTPHPAVHLVGHPQAHATPGTAGTLNHGGRDVHRGVRRTTVGSGVGFLRRGVGYARDTTTGWIGSARAEVEEEEEDVYLDIPFFEEEGEEEQDRDDEDENDDQQQQQQQHPTHARLAKRKEWTEDARQQQQQGLVGGGEHGRDWCSEAEYLDGEWVLRDELVTPETIRKVYKYTDKGKLRCQSKSYHSGQPQPQPDEPAYFSRIWETAQYVWAPRSGCRKHGWTRWAFAKYCLRARAGCSLVGDSLADQLYVVIRESMVSNTDSLFEIHPSTELIFNITVNRLHPDAPRLAAEAGVSWERLERPLFYYWREHHLLHRDELDEVFSKAVGYRPWVGGMTYKENGWIWDRSWWLELWRGELEKPVDLFPVTGAAAGGHGHEHGHGHGHHHAPREEKSVISFSSGPHWTTTELWPRDGWVTRNFDELLRGWAGMFNKVTHHVNEVVGEGHKVLAWWRSSVPGHFECWQYDRPENDRTDPFSTQRPDADAYNWKLYPFMDDYASSRTRYKPSNSTHRIGSRHGMQYMDLWTFSVKRPEAHLSPLNDEES